jgi:hypothetical protein
MDGRDGGELAAQCERLADEALASAAAADEVASTPGGRL